MSALISEVRAQVPNTQGASSPPFLILSGLQGDQVVQESQGSSAPSLPRNSRCRGCPGSPISPWPVAGQGWGKKGIASVPRQRQGKT